MTWVFEARSTCPSIDAHATRSFQEAFNESRTCMCARWRKEISTFFRIVTRPTRDLTVRYTRRSPCDHGAEHVSPHEPSRAVEPHTILLHAGWRGDTDVPLRDGAVRAVGPDGVAAERRYPRCMFTGRTTATVSSDDRVSRDRVIRRWCHLNRKSPLLPDGLSVESIASIMQRAASCPAARTDAVVRTRSLR